jgi:hypothetical protein
MRLIGITGRMGAGKDTAFKHIARVARECGETAVRQAFADKLKVSAARALGFDGPTSDLVGVCNNLKVSGNIMIEGDGCTTSLTGRQFLQWYGTEAHRDVFGTDFWVDALLPLGEAKGFGSTPRVAIARLAWQDNFPGADYAVVTDVRFPNEAQRILDLGGEVWLVDADERLGANAETHASEATLPHEYITLVLYNNNSWGMANQIERLLS